MKKRILCVILSLAAVFSLIGFNATEAWFSDGDNKGMELKSGNLDFTANANISLKETDVEILPETELELAEAIVITNNSTIDTELRIYAECVYEDEEEKTKESFPYIEFVRDGADNWVSKDDGYIYYCPNGNNVIPAPKIPEETTVATTETTTAEAEAVSDEEQTTETTTEEITIRVYAENEIPFAGKIKISGDVPAKFNGKTVKINFVIQAKQSEFMEWSDFTPVSENETTENPAE